MNETYKVVGVRYPSYYDLQRKVDIQPVVADLPDKMMIKPMIEKLLFESKMNYALVKWGGRMYVCEPTDLSKRTFVKSEVTWHPYMSLT